MSRLRALLAGLVCRIRCWRGHRWQEVPMSVYGRPAAVCDRCGRWDWG